MPILGRLLERAHIARQEGDYTFPVLAAAGSIALLYTLLRTTTQAPLHLRRPSGSASTTATGLKAQLASFGSSDGRVIIPAPSYDQAHADYPANLYGGGRRISTPYGHIQLFCEGPLDGPRILLVHGITTPSPVFKGVWKALLAKGYRVATYDLWGRGFSDAPIGIPMNDAAYSFQLLSVLAHLGWSAVSSDAANKASSKAGSEVGYTLLGYSLGGGIAASFAAHYPQGIHHLILVAPAGLLDASTLSLSRKLVQMSAVPVWIVEALQALVVPKKMEEVKRRVSGDAIDTTAVLDWQKETHKGFAHAYLSSFRAGPIFDQEFLYGKVQSAAEAGMQVLAIWGAEDDIVVAKPVSDRLLEIVPSAELIMVDGIGHDICTAVPVELAEHVHTFVEKK